MEDMIGHEFKENRTVEYNSLIIIIIKELTYGRSRFILQRLSLVTQLVRGCLWKI